MAEAAVPAVEKRELRHRRLGPWNRTAWAKNISATAGAGGGVKRSFTDNRKKTAGGVKSNPAAVAFPVSAGR
jgi:hypothetical protein